MSDVAERVKKIVVELLGVDEAKVTENASFMTIWEPTALTPSSW